MEALPNGNELARASLCRSLSRAQAEAVQAALAEHVLSSGLKLADVRTVAGAACVDADDEVIAAAALLTFPALELMEQATARAEPGMGYVSGLRAFREGAALVAAVENLGKRPDALFVRGHGLAHPRRCGLASHVGLALGLPSIGCALRALASGAGRRSAGMLAHSPGCEGTRRTMGSALSFGEPGDCAPLVDEHGQHVGASVVTRPGSRPLLVSVGHMIDLGTAVALTLACCRGHVMPEPLGMATMAARRAAGT